MSEVPGHEPGEPVGAGESIDRPGLRHGSRSVVPVTADQPGEDAAERGVTLGSCRLDGTPVHPEALEPFELPIQSRSKRRSSRSPRRDSPRKRARSWMAGPKEAVCQSMMRGESGPNSTFPGWRSP